MVSTYCLGSINFRNLFFGKQLFAQITLIKLAKPPTAQLGFNFSRDLFEDTLLRGWKEKKPSAGF